MPKLYLRGEGMQFLPESPGDTSGETLSESSSSPQTPLDAGAHFVHAAMNQCKSAFRANPEAIHFLALRKKSFHANRTTHASWWPKCQLHIMFSHELGAIYLSGIQFGCNAKFHALRPPDAATFCVTVVALPPHSTFESYSIFLLSVVVKRIVRICQIRCLTDKINQQQSKSLCTRKHILLRATQAA